MYAVNGILFNHESERRGETFVTRKITLAAARIAAGKQEKLYLGNLNARRDWGYAKDYVECMWMMLQHPEPEDFVIATGETRTVREFAEKAFACAGMELHWQGEGVEEKGSEERPLYEVVGEQVASWGAECMGDSYSYVGAVVGATYPEQGKILRKIMPKAYILVPGYGAQGGKGADLVHFFNEDGLGAIINSSRGIIAAYQQEKYAGYGAEHFADASRAAVLDMKEDIAQALAARI